MDTAPTVLGDAWLASHAPLAWDAVSRLRASGWASPLFPLLWTGMPLFWLAMGVVRVVEGAERQRFNAEEARASLRNQMVLGVLWSGPLGAWLVDPKATWAGTVEAARGDLWGVVRDWTARTAVAALITDGVFYWVHRALHEVEWLWPTHAHHHRWRAKHTVWGALDESLDELATIFAYVSLPFWLKPACAELVAAYVAGGAVQTAVMHGTTTGGWWFPPFPLVGAKTHHTHHMHERKNYGGVFVFWDWVMGTYKASSSSSSVEVAKPAGVVVAVDALDMPRGKVASAASVAS